jgi:hypothetical protein
MYIHLHVYRHDFVAFSKAGAVPPVSFLAVRHRDLPRLVDLDLGDVVYGGDSTFMVMGFRIDL